MIRVVRHDANYCPRDREFGEIETRLDAHDKRFDSINGNIARFALAVETLTAAVNAAAADNKAGGQTALALKEADAERARLLHEEDERRRDQNEADEELRRKALSEAAEKVKAKADARWSPVSKFLLIANGSEGVLLTWLAYRNFTGKG